MDVGFLLKLLWSMEEHYLLHAPQIPCTAGIQDTFWPDWLNDRRSRSCDTPVRTEIIPGKLSWNVLWGACCLFKGSTSPSYWRMNFLRSTSHDHALIMHSVSDLILFNVQKRVLIFCCMRQHASVSLPVPEMISVHFFCASLVHLCWFSLFWFFFFFLL